MNPRRRTRIRWWVGLLALAGVAIVAALVLSLWRPSAQPPAVAEPTSIEGNLVRYTDGDIALTVEFLDDDLVHLELSSGMPLVQEAIPTTPMMAETNYDGPTRLVRTEDGAFETAELRISVGAGSLCLTAIDLRRTPPLALSEICPYHLDRDMKGVTLRSDGFTHVYGLGQKFMTPGATDGEWSGESRYPGDYGNVMEGFNQGMAGNTQIPILYAVGAGTEAFALFFDDPHKQFFDFTGSTWKASLQTDTVRFYLLSGPDLRDLRRDYLELTGRPPVPPKKMFGLWVSEYGYESWAEIWDKLSTLRAGAFPVDGFVLDLQWYGGIQQGSDDTRMGSLTWDREAFPDPESAIHRLETEQGIGLMTIEQSYVGRSLPEHADLAGKGFLVQECEGCPPVYLTQNPWWGKGGMIDWTNPEAGAYWHETKRAPLVDAGIMGHWTDLGEPEAFDPSGWYAGVDVGGQLLHEHVEVHNLYNFLWSRSVFEGYQREGRLQRPFILSRSGAPGSQRFGVAMWSGDLSGLLTTLAAQLNAQMHMSLSGIDYYGSDVGGFWRQDVDMVETYTQWFADSAAIDVPLRPHTFNLQNEYETAPDRIGDVASNLANLRLRYRLVPYLYSLAHEAYRSGEAVFPPLVYAFMEDPAVRELGGERMIGPGLLVALVAQEGLKETRVYLPAGVWTDFHTGDRVESQGEWIGPLPLYPEGSFRLPLFARPGAIIPLMYVDGETMNVTGRRRDGTVRDELIVRVYAAEAPSQFTLYEDDGTTTAYQDGEVRTTVIRQTPGTEGIEVTIEAASGSYDGAIGRRQNVVKLYVGESAPESVLLNGVELVRLTEEAEFEAAETGWMMAADGSVWVRTGVLDVATAKRIEFRFATTTPG